MSDAPDALASDLLTGLEEIASYLGWTVRQTKHRDATGEVPTFRLGKGRTVYARRSTLGYVARRREMKSGVRELHELDLHEISLTPIPLHQRAIVTSVKSIASVNDLRTLFQEKGFSGRQAKAAAGAAWRAIHDNEDEPDAAELVAILDASAARIAGL